MFAIGLYYFYRRDIIYSFSSEMAITTYNLVSRNWINLLGNFNDLISPFDYKSKYTNI